MSDFEELIYEDTLFAFSDDELTDACDIGDLETMKKLLSKDNVNPDLNLGDLLGNALMNASFRNNVDVVKYLLSRGEDLGLEINKEDDYGETALYSACEQGHTEVVKMLLVYSDIDTGDIPDKTNDDCRKLLKEHKKSPKEYRQKYSHLVFGKNDACLKDFLKIALTNSGYLDIQIRVVNLQKPLNEE